MFLYQRGIKAFCAKSLLKSILFYSPFSHFKPFEFENTLELLIWPGYIMFVLHNFGSYLLYAFNIHIVYDLIQYNDMLMNSSVFWFNNSAWWKQGKFERIKMANLSPIIYHRVFPIFPSSHILQDKYSSPRLAI